MEVNHCKYLAPLSSPELKSDFNNGKIRKSIVPIIRIVKLGTTDVLLGKIKLSSMIPIYDVSVIKYYEINQEQDLKYKNLVMDELKFMYANKELILKNANKLYRQKINHMSMGYIQATVDFQLLEEKAKLYKK
ncbi:MAG TPA: type III toxin-antitoxin system ToxN/AbiQ family toxin [Fusobacterium sp.]|uniref:type III toxin-antitoxin system ToxN/AbiQ family toxin n=1 Tax=Fusobacterium sp. TaxID=68766 RepID=UPI002F40DEDC